MCGLLTVSAQNSSSTSTRLVAPRQVVRQLSVEGCLVASWRRPRTFLSNCPVALTIRSAKVRIKRDFTVCR